MPLKGKKPEDRKQRLKLLLSGPAGVGKTMASIQMPKPYIIDTESGSTHYGQIIEKAGGAVADLTTFDEVIAEVRALHSEPHDYLTLVIDPITTLWNTTLEETERLVGTEFGRHYGEANKRFKRLCALLTAIDMNVIVTAHEKNEYGDELKVVGKTFDGFKKLDYIFDLWLQLDRQRGETERFATVAKTRLIEFPDQDRFPWSYDAVMSRFGVERLEKGTETESLATTEQIKRFRALYERLSEAEKKTLKIDKAIAKYGEPEDWTEVRMAEALEHIDQQLGVAA